MLIQRNRPEEYMMAPAEITERDGTKPNPPLLGSLAYLVLNLPFGIASFVFVVTTVSVGVSTAIIWVGLAVLAVGMLVWRGAAKLERLRVHRMLGTYVATPYQPLPNGLSKQLMARVRDGATWKDLTYFLLLLPIGIAEFTIMVSFWSVSVWLLLTPVYFGFLPDEWYPVVWDNPVFTVDSTVEALPLAAVGAILLAVTVVLTKSLGALHARYARAMLGPSSGKLSAMERTTVASAFDRDQSRRADFDFRTHVYPGV